MRIYIVWIDILRSDDRYSAYLRSTEFSDPRVSYFWDRYKLSGVEWQEVLAMDDVAWDIYFLYDRNAVWGEIPYDRDAVWGDIPSYPAYIMDQIGLPEDVSHHLDGDKLATRIGELTKEK